MAQTTTTARLAELLVPFAEAVSINVRDAGNTLRKRVLVSLQFVDTRQLHDRLFPGQHLDWQAKDAFLGKATYSTAEWASILALFHFINEPQVRQQTQEMVAGALAGMKITTYGKGSLDPIDSMRVCFAKAGMAPTWDTLAKSLLLCNLADVDHAAGLAAVLPSESSITALIGHLAAVRHTPDEYAAVFEQLLCENGCHIASHVLMKSLKLRDEAAERTKRSTERMMRAAVKPSLTRLIEELASKSRKDSTSGDFQAFCNAVRLPFNVSAKLRRACYYIIVCLPCATPENTKDLVSRLVGGDQVVMEAMMALMLKRRKGGGAPDMDTVAQFLAEVQHHSGPPPKCLSDFKEACLVGLPSSWSAVLRLYLASYCACTGRELWAQCLDNAMMIIPAETENAIHAFVATRPVIAFDDLAYTLIEP